MSTVTFYSCLCCCQFDERSSFWNFIYMLQLSTVWFLQPKQRSSFKFLPIIITIVALLWCPSCWLFIFICLSKLTYLSLFWQEALKNYCLVFDAIYTPKWTRLLTEAQESGAAVVFGTEMFLNQAFVQVEKFSGIPGKFYMIDSTFLVIFHIWHRVIFYLIMGFLLIFRQCSK